NRGRYFNLDAARLLRLGTALAVVAVAIAATSGGAAANGIGSAYVAEGGAKRLAIIDVESMAAVDVIATSGSPSGLVVSADGKAMYATQKDTNNLMIINRDDYTTTATVTVGTSPVSISLSPDNKLGL